MNIHHSKYTSIVYYLIMVYTVTQMYRDLIGLYTFCEDFSRIQ